MSVRAIRDVLDRHSLALHKDRGQNFLIESAQAERLAELAGVGAGDAIVEVGTGLGVLTRALAARARAVWTVEVDAGLVRALRAESLLPANATLIHADALKTDWPDLVAQARRGRAAGGAVRVVANLPYATASPLLRLLLDLRAELSDWSVMLQREVAARITARSGTRDYGSLAVLHQLCAQVETVLDLPPGAFYPPPRVASRFVRVTPRTDSPLAADELEAVERVVRALFGQRRKTAAGVLRRMGYAVDRVAAALEMAGLAPNERAERCPPEQLLALVRALA